MADDTKFIWGTGRRKTSVARVRIKKGTGKFLVNRRELEEKIRVSLQSQGFGVLTEIDVKSTLNEKIGVDFKPYKILGACNQIGRAHV